MPPPIRIVLPLLVILAVSRGAHAGPPRRAVMVEVDPSTFVLGGFSAHVRFEPRPAQRWLVGAGLYALDLPSLVVDLNPANRDEAWDVRFRLGYGVFVDRLLGHGRGGPSVGIQVALQHMGAGQPNAEQARFVNALVMPRVGYTVHPFDGRFYVFGWLGVGATGTVAGRTGGYDVFPAVAFAAVHAGMRFD